MSHFERKEESQRTFDEKMESYRWKDFETVWLKKMRSEQKDIPDIVQWLGDFLKAADTQDIKRRHLKRFIECNLLPDLMTLMSYELGHLGEKGFSSGTLKDHLPILEALWPYTAAEVQSPSYGGIVLEGACENGSIEMAEFAMQKGVSINYRSLSNNNTPLLCAIAFSQPDLALWLMEKGACVHQSNDFGISAVHGAAQTGKLEVLQELIKRGANLHRSSHHRLRRRERKKAENVLHYAARFLQGPVIDFLIHQGFSLETPGMRGKTAIHLAIEPSAYRPRQESIDIVKKIILAGANIEAKSSDGDTPLLRAIGSRNFDITELLISSGANVIARDRLGRTGLDIAKLSSDKKIIELLKDITLAALEKEALDEITTASRNSVAKSEADRVIEEGKPTELKQRRI